MSAPLAAPAPLRALGPLALGILVADAVAFRSGSWPAPAVGTSLLTIPGGLATVGGFAWRHAAGPALALFGLGVLLGALHLTSSTTPLLDRAAAGRAPSRISGRVVAVETRADGGWRLRLRTDRDGPGRGAIIRVTGPDSIPEPEAAATIRVRGRLVRPPAPTNPGEFDGRRHLLRQGIAYRLSVRTPEDLERIAPPSRLAPERGLAGLRASMGRCLDRRLDDFPLRFTRVLLLGDRVAFRPEEEAEFRAVGVTHILSVSGLHVGIVAATVQVLLGRRRRRGALAVALAGIWIYTLLVGAPSAAVRSAGMLSLALAARHAQRPAGGWTLLSGGLLLLFLAAPGLLFDLGLQLSALSVAGLLVAHALWPAERLASLPAWLRRPLEALALTLGAQLATLPLTLPPWGDWPLMAPAGNLLVVGLSDLVLTGGLIGVALEPLFPWAADQAIALTGLLARLVQLGVHALALASPGIRGLPPPPPGIGPLFLAMATLTVARALGPPAARRPLRLLVPLTLLLAVALVATPRIPPAGLCVTVIDVGQGDATLVEFPDGRTMLVDGGEGGVRDTGARLVIPVLRRARIRELDAVVVSHQHHDHLGGLFAVIRDFRVRRVFDSGFGPADGEARAFQRLCAERRRPICLVAAGDTILAGRDYAVTVIGPERPTDPSDDYIRPGNVLNDLSLVLRIEWRGRVVLLPGDAEAPAEAELLPRVPAGPIDLLKAGHHGSRTSSTPAWLERLSPRLVAVPVGLGNRFRHPSRDVLERMRAGGAVPLRSDERGALRFTWGHSGLRVDAWGNGRGGGAGRWWLAHDPIP